MQYCVVTWRDLTDSLATRSKTPKESAPQTASLLASSGGGAQWQTPMRSGAALDERILVLDGAWGTMLQGAGLAAARLPGRDLRRAPARPHRRPDLLNLTRPDVILDIHRQYLAAGADITTTNTFTATSIGQADYGLEGSVRDMNLAGARLARQAADEAGGKLVAGSVGPLNVTLSLSPRVDDPSFRTVTFDQVYAAYAEQIARARRGRRRPAADRDDLRHAQRQGRDRRGPRRRARTCRCGSRSPSST